MKTKAIEGWKEQYGQDYNWGILAFPGNPTATDEQDNKEIILYDHNSLDKYRFLYLWRTYVSGGITYKIILE